MNTTATRTTKQSMTNRFLRLAAGAAVSVAFMTTAAPAMAQNAPEPAGGSVERIVDPQVPVTSTPAAPAVDVSSAALGALGGIALGGMGLGIMVGVQRRRDHSAIHHA
ncbi:hypothetical protein OHA18_01480 [Kribbella sp. NBC_00709]|uniref:hypothetical protein n=1 Tax=Kribbella sp. NBC_00709 TaxID=2975972 RepID=UPI002E2A4E33|nr:hypothetical protein [Kribbella sp. NBC_00709]